MKRVFMACTLALAAPLTLAADKTDMTQLRQEIEQLKADYEQRLRALDARVQKAEAGAQDAQANAAAAQTAASAPAAASATTASGTAFNPQVSVILDGTYGKFSRDPAHYVIPGFALAPEAKPGKRGPSLGESELAMSANVDDKFYSEISVSLLPDGGASVEQAFFQSLELPASLTVKAGRFFSGIGYLNEQHSHVWDFVDQPLAYRAMLDNQYGDDGVQVRWLAPTDTFLEFGGELLRGDAFPGGGATGNGPGARSAFVHTGGDVGISNSWSAGLSQLRTQAHSRETGDASPPDTFTGDSTVSIADVVWKWSPNGNPVNTNFKLQGEYLRRSENGLFNNTPYDATQHGVYLQGIYQFMPRWRVGVRHDWLAADNPGIAFAGTALNTLGHTPKRDSAMVDFSNSEFSRFRLQYNHDQSQPTTDNQWYLQYIMSIGAHGAHQF